MTKKKEIIFAIGTLLIVLLVGFFSARAIYKDFTIVTGGINHNVQEDFAEGITVDGTEVLTGSGKLSGHLVATATPSTYPTIGGSTQPGCIVMGDTDAAGISYTTVLNGTLTTTGGASGQFTIPEDCQN